MGCLLLKYNLQLKYKFSACSVFVERVPRHFRSLAVIDLLSPVLTKGESYHLVILKLLTFTRRQYCWDSNNNLKIAGIANPPSYFQALPLEFSNLLFIYKLQT